MNSHDIEDICELTPLQQGILFHSLFNPKSGVYLQQVACALRGELNATAFQLAWQEVVDRHTILRTFFHYDNPKKPLQVVSRKVKLIVDQLDWQRLALEEQEIEMEQFLQADRERGFDLTAAPLMRFTLIRTGEQDHQFVWSSHHLLMDGWSRSLLLKEVFALYLSFCNGQRIELGPAQPFRHYITWLQQQDLSKAEEFWRGVLNGFTAPTPFVVDHLPGKQTDQATRFAEQRKSIAGVTADKLQSVARQHQLTLNTVVQGAWAMLLSRYSGQSDVVFGTTVSGRSTELAGVGTMVGLLINTLPVRVQMNNDETVTRWLKQIQTQQMDARQYEYSPLVKVQAWSGILRGQPLFESLVAFENYPVDRIQQNQMMQSSGLQLSGTRLVTQTNYPITLVIVPEEELDLRLSYDEDRLDADTIRRMLGHFERLLEDIAANPQKRVSEIEMLTETERRQLLEEWNTTGKAELIDRNLYEMFEAQVERSPDATAIVYEQDKLSYRELNRRANQLANHLLGLGIGIETRIGILLERSLDMVVAILGALKAGGAFVPMDPGYPKARLDFMIEDADIALVLTHHDIINRLGEFKGVVCKDMGGGEISSEREDNLALKISPENLAYVIYTSGSTGKPKGAMIRHGSVVNYSRGLLNAIYGEKREAFRVTLNAPLIFDASIKQLVQMFAGHTLYIVPEEIRRDGQELLAYIQNHRLQVLDCTPSQWKFLQAAGIERNPQQTLVMALVGGETIDAVTWKAFAESERTDYFNMYGPTECTVNTTVCHVHRNLERPTIGRPLPGIQIYILDENMQPVPVGVIGEIYIGGEGLARGYLKRPILTAEKFIPNPFSKQPGARLYRSGDLARYMDDGNIEYTGRYDHQIKLRGIRVELREIEEAIAQHANIERAAAHLREDESGDKRLVAYVVPNAASTLSVSDIRNHLKERLPDYMIPSAFMIMDALPLTPTGKLDRQMLPAPYWVRPDLKEEFVPAQTAVEQLLVNTWSQVLGVEQVGIHDNFFELGGDSILTIQIVARAKKAGLKISARHVFEHQTIHQLASMAVMEDATDAEQGIVTGIIPLTPIQRRFFEFSPPDIHYYNQAVLLEVHQRVSPALLQRAVNKLVEHHDSLRLRFKFSGSDWRQFNASSEDVALLTVIDLSSLPESAQQLALKTTISAAQAGLNISEGPIYRVALIDFGDDKPGRLFFVIHHLAVDGVSWRFLLEDLQTAITQASEGEQINLPAKTTSFKKWAESLSQYASSDEVEKESTYWLQLMTGATPRLPVDYPGGSNTVQSEASVSLSLSIEETRAILKEVPAVYNTRINDVLLMALAEAIGRWTGDRIILIDLEGHGREEKFEDVDVSRTAGWFTTVFPLLLNLKEDLDTGNRLKLIKEQIRRIPNRGFCYGLLRYLSKDSDIAGQLRMMPQPEISFNYLGQFDQVLAGSSMFSEAGESVGLSQSIKGNRRYLLQVHGRVSNGQLKMELAYSSNLHQRSTIEYVMQAFVNSLRKIISHCRSMEARVYTPSDFPLSKLNQNQLDEFINNNGHIEDIYCLSPLQEGLLFYSMYSLGSGMYFTQSSFTVRGQIALPAFEQAWQYVEDRHSILRTSFLLKGLNEPVQVVHRQVKLPWENYDWRDMTEAEQHQSLEAYLESDRERGFDLSEAPLMRLALIRLSEDTYELVWSHHHLLLDGWSMPLLFREVFAAYEALCQGIELDFAPPRPFRDYIAWLQRQDGSKAENYWRRTLKGFKSPTTLVVDYAPGNRQSGQEKFGEERELLSREFTSELQSLARKYQLTLSTLLQGAWALLLNRYSGDPDVLFGATVSGRPASLPAVETILGLFINTLPVRAQVIEDQTTVNWLKGFQTQQVEAREYEYSPLVKVQGWSDVARGLPLFESLVVFENYPVDASLQDYIKRTSGLEVVDVSVIERGTDPLVFTIVDSEQLYLRLTYDPERFDQLTIKRMMGHVETLLEEMVSKPDQCISELALLSAAERRQLLVEWPGLHNEYKPDKRVNDLFEAQVERTPYEAAVIYQDQRLSYFELNRRANQLAHHLRGLGVGPESLVGVCLERSVEMVIALIGVLKAGGGYLPIDPAYPKHRISFMLEDSQARVLLTQEKFIKEISDSDARTLCVDSDWEIIAQESGNNPVTLNEVENLAYLIYTSGSTGKPKGVMVSNASLVNYVKVAVDEFNLQVGDRVLQFATISFDTSAEEIYPCLASGGTLVLRTNSMLDSIAIFLQKCESWGITVLDLPTAYWHELADGLAAGGLELPSSLRLVIVGGEKVLPNKLAAWRENVNPRVRLLNTYGPTEATIVATTADLSERAPGESTFAEISIGSAISNVQVYILDSYLRPCPAGVPGQIYISGAGLSRGYFKRPDLTAEMFIANPYSNKPGARFYKTGDRGRYLPDGDIEFLGRLDNQVKIRGFRVELGEIVSLLKTHPATREAEVLAREDKLGNKRLVAYVVPAPQGSDFNEPSSEADLSMEQVSQWNEVFDDLFREKDQNQETTFYIKGWNSSYTGLPIPAQEVSEWMSQTVDRILPLRPTEVFEIGCGSGLMLFRIAPHCKRYYATDLSKNILNILEGQLAISADIMPEIALFQRSADNFEGIEADSFDALFMVSVIQYFPGVEYLLRVLEKAVNTVRPGGFIFIGDVRNLALLEAFHASVQLYRASSSLSRSELRERVKTHLLSEKQLVIDPEFFIALKQHLPKISHVEIQLMRGHHHNELTKFRYDVALHIGDEVDSCPNLSWLDWGEQNLTVPSVRQLLGDTSPDLLAIAGVPLSRVMKDMQIVELLCGDGGPETVGGLREVLSQPGSDGIDPEAIWQLGDELPYVVNITWSNSYGPGSFDVVFKRREAAGSAMAWNRDICISRQTVAARPWSEYANDPTQGTYASKLVPQLQEFFKQRLPEYMMPSAFVILDSMPLTPSGKIDRQALPALAGYTAGSKEDFVAPRTPVEEVVAGIWAEVLGHDQIGVFDNFFDLGGHSLLATQIISRLRGAFNFEVPMHSLFDVPNVAGLAEKIEAIRLSHQGLKPPAITPFPRDGDLPLSFAQQRMWFINQLETTSPAYNIPYAVRLSGPLSVNVLERSLNEIVRRHEILRTTFESIKGRPIQVIAKPKPFSLPIIDLSHARTDHREAEVRRLTGEEASQPFDLTKGPMLRVKLLRLDEAENVILLTMHHIVSDGWSIGLLVQEVSELYEAYSKGEESPLDELQIQYSDYAMWQREWFQGEVLEKQMQYWRQQLEGPLPVLELPTDRPRPAIQTYRGGSDFITLSSGITESLRQLSRQQGCTMFMTLLSALQVLLYRYTGQEDVLVGTPIAGRNMGETEQLIGFFVNSLVMRTNLKEKPSFVQVMKRVREVSLGAYAHQDMPFEKLVAELQPERDLGRSPLFQVMLVLQNVIGGELKIAGAQVKSVGVENNLTKFDLMLSVIEKDKELQAVTTYNADLFDESTIKRMGEHLKVLLEEIAGNEEKKISSIEILSKAERHQILRGWNNTWAAYPEHHCAHELFTAQANSSPMAVAVTYGNQALTYGELNERTDQWARYLRDCEVEPEIRVGVYVERGLEMIVALLAVLKAGGVYVPIATNYPEDRIRFVLEDAEIKVLLTQEHLAGGLPKHLARIVCLDADRDEIERENPGEIVAVTSPLNLAYAIYTSGSTGEPKGVLIEHRGLMNHLWAKIVTLELNGQDVVAQNASLSFDISIWQMLAALLTGGSVCVIGDWEAMDGRMILEEVGRCGVTVLETVPVMFGEMVKQQLNNREARLKLSALRWVICNAEPLPVTLCEEWFACYPEIQLINAYGATECSDDTHHHYMTADSLPNGAYAPLGKPLINTEAYLLDANQQPVPVGVAGEIYLGGVGVGRGYLNRADLTAERFVPHPFSDQAGARLYRIMDQGRWRTDGSLEFLSRLDFQVKIRGYRIEIGEIESALNKHPKVKQSIVIAREDTTGDKRLIGYVVAKQGEQVEGNDLSRYLREKLPEYMIPAAIVMMEQMPISPNGKIDRNRLPALEQKMSARRLLSRSSNQTEDLVAGIWEEVLGVEVAVDENFFEIGGHSLLATQVISRIRQVFQEAIGLRDIFEKPTVKELAASIERARASGLRAEAPPIEAVSRDEDLPLSFAQQGLWFLDQLEPNNSFYNLPAAINLKGSLNIEAMEKTLSEIVRRHEVLRTRIITKKGKLTQVIDKAKPVKLAALDLSDLPGTESYDEALRLANEEANQPFNLGEGPLLRVSLIRLDKEDHVVLLTMHHIVSDAWSVGVLIDEVGALYAAFLEGKESSLPDLQIQYADYSKWQRRWLAGEVLEEHLSYWKKQLAGSPPLLNLPLDRPRPKVQSFRGTRQSFLLSSELTAELNALSRREDATLFMTLLAAFSTLLYRYTHEEDIVVGTAIAGRNRIEIEKLIGFFVNILPMRIDLSNNPRFHDLIKQVREVALGAYDHQDLPFEKLVMELQPDRQMGYKPIFQIAFGLQNAPREVLEIPGLSLSSIKLDHEVVRFDLTLWVSEAVEGLQVHWTYNTDLFNDDTISQMHMRFERFLEGVVSQPDARLNSLEILTQDEILQRDIQAKTHQEIGYKKFLSAKPKMIRVE